ncbi:MAG: hypothetical protein HKN47_15330 [Pirellulaceae bacterium]|nr:hypothetical protein [Pirellulaceae bacterium]
MRVCAVTLSHADKTSKRLKQTNAMLRQIFMFIHLYISNRSIWEGEICRRLTGFERRNQFDYAKEGVEENFTLRISGNQIHQLHSFITPTIVAKYRQVLGDQRSIRLAGQGFIGVLASPNIGDSNSAERHAAVVGATRLDGRDPNADVDSSWMNPQKKLDAVCVEPWFDQKVPR